MKLDANQIANRVAKVLEERDVNPNDCQGMHQHCQNMQVDLQPVGEPQVGHNR